MPTDLVAVLARKNMDEAQAQKDTAILLLWLVLCLVNVGMVLLDPAFARVVEFASQY